MNSEISREKLGGRFPTYRLVDFLNKNLVAWDTTSQHIDRIMKLKLVCLGKETEVSGRRGQNKRVFADYISNNRVVPRIYYKPPKMKY